MKRLLMAAPLLLLACATKSEILSLPSDAGAKASYRAPFDKVQLAAQDSSGELGFAMLPDETVKTDSEIRFMSSQGMGSGTSGRYLRARLVKEAGGEVTVYVVIRSKVEGDEAKKSDPLIEQDFQKKLAARLAAK